MRDKQVLSSAHQKAVDEDIQSKLERLTRAVADLVKAKDFDFTSSSSQEVKKHLSTDLKYKPGGPATAAVPFAQQRQVWIREAQNNPNICYRVLETTSTISEHLGRGSVFMTIILTGTLGINLQIWTEFKWRREWDGVWRCYWVSALYSMPDPGNEFDSRMVTEAVTWVCEAARRWHGSA